MGQCTLTEEFKQYSKAEGTQEVDNKEEIKKEK